MEEKGLKLAPQKTEIFILVGRFSLRNFNIRVSSGNTVGSKTVVRDLGVNISIHLSMWSHLMQCTQKAV